MHSPPKINLGHKSRKARITTTFGSSSQDQSIENNTESWNKNQSSAHPSTCALTYAELIALKVYSVKLK